MITSEISETLEEFLARGQEETHHPYLTPRSRPWGKLLTLKASLTALFSLITAYSLSFYSLTLSNFFLVFVFFLAGTPALINTVNHLLKLKINISVLMTLAAFLSIAIGSQLEGGLLLVLFSLSEAMESMVSQKTKSAIYSLRKLTPTMANVIEKDGSILERSVKEISVGTEILVRQGELIPLDGEIIKGQSLIGLMHLTGESNPESLKEGDAVFSGSYNIDGTLYIRITRPSSESTIAKIIDMIVTAGTKKPRVQTFLDRFGEYYSTAIILIALFFALGLPLFSSIPFIGFEGSIYRSLAFLIAASPCALIIAIPTAYLSAISACAKRGVMLKGGLSLDALAKCNTIVFDKTGTLTTGKLECISVEALGDHSITSKEAISVATSMEMSVKHPIASALIEYAKKQNLPIVPTQSLKPIPGRGIEGKVTINKQLYSCQIGNFDFITQSFHDQDALSQVKPKEKKKGQVVTYLKIDSSLFVFHFLDELRKGMKELIDSLHREARYQVVMLTGDHSENATHVAEMLGIDQYFFDLKPEGKLQQVEALSTDRQVAFVGDGINDAPSMARSHIGIALGEIGSAPAIDAADIVLLKDDVKEISWLIKRAQMTMRIVKENLTLALGVICFATTPALLGYIPLWLAVILHEGGTVLVGLNSLRLLRSK